MQVRNIHKSLQKHSYLANAIAATANPIPQNARLRRIRILRLLNLFALSSFSVATGIYIATIPAVATLTHMLSLHSDADTLSMYKPPDEFAEEVDKYIQDHPLVRSLKEDPDFTESRPHLKIPDHLRKHTLTGGTLAGPGKITVPPIVFSEKDGKSLVSVVYLGTDVCGHSGIVHGGLLATLLDEGLARCCFPALPNKIGLTANLTVNYRKPAPAGSFFCLKAETVKVEGRKAWVKGWIETLVGEGKEPVVLVEAEALYVEPKQAAVSFIISG